jgi:hypothetical protein
MSFAFLISKIFTMSTENIPDEISSSTSTSTQCNDLFDFVISVPAEKPKKSNKKKLNKHYKNNNAFVTPNFSHYPGNHFHPHQGNPVAVPFHPHQGNPVAVPFHPHQGNPVAVPFHPHQGKQAAVPFHPHQGKKAAVPFHPHQEKSSSVPPHKKSEDIPEIMTPLVMKALKIQLAHTLKQLEEVDISKMYSNHEVNVSIMSFAKFIYDEMQKYPETIPIIEAMKKFRKESTKDENSENNNKLAMDIKTAIQSFLDI